MLMIVRIINVSLIVIILVGRIVMNLRFNGGYNEYCNKKLKVNFI